MRPASRVGASGPGCFRIGLRLEPGAPEVIEPGFFIRRAGDCLPPIWMAADTLPPYDLLLRVPGAGQVRVPRILGRRGTGK
jgi:hypothetical protein